MIETKRLLIQPLSCSQLTKYAENNHSLEDELGILATKRIISAELKEALEQTIRPGVAANESNYLYFTLWTIILKPENQMVGDLCFMGLPNDNGEIEIGYGTYDEFQKRGFMTEAVGGMIEWARKQADVKAITASTDKTNTASFTVLQKNQFVKVGESEGSFHWKREL